MHHLLPVRSIVSDETGQDLAEYGLLVLLIAVVVAIAVALLGTTINDAWVEITTTLAELL